MSENKKLTQEEITEITGHLISILEKAASREEEYDVVTKRGIDYLTTELGCTREEALETIKYTVKRIIDIEIEKLEAVSKRDEPKNSVIGDFDYPDEDPDEPDTK